MIDLLMDEVSLHLPYLRRHACALTGSRAAGDACVRACLETVLLGEASNLGESGDIRRDLFRLLARTIDAMAGERRPVPDGAGAAEAITPTLIADRVAGLPREQRRVLLLRLLDGFEIEDVAYILGLDPAEAAWLLEGARLELMRQRPTSVMIIEDEPPLARALAALMRDAGHRVAGVAASREEAVALSAHAHPGLVLADTRLGDDAGAGIAAVREIRRHLWLPVVFLGAPPDRLGTARKRGPTFLVSKPLEPALVLSTVSQALLVVPRLAA